jgi:thymidylate kinase
MKKEETELNIMTKVRETFVNQPWGEVDNYFVIDAQRDVPEIAEEIKSIVCNLID